jgi:hypothetical protein
MLLDELEKLSDLIRLCFAVVILNVEQFGQVWMHIDVMAPHNSRSVESESLGQTAEVLKPDVSRPGEDLLEELSPVSHLPNPG